MNAFANDPTFSSPSPPLPLKAGLGAWFRGLIDPLLALVYLRFHMRRNAWQRESILGQVVTTVFFAAAAIGVLGAFAMGVATGYTLYTKLQWEWRLLFWNGLVITFLLVWFIHVSTEVFRNDVLTLDRVMHLPISPSHAFVLNYLSSLINFPIVYFASFTTGVLVGASVAQGPSILLLWLALVAYMLMVTALTSHFQGALAAWMATPRRRQTVMVAFSLFFVFVFPAMAIGIPRLIRMAERPTPTVPADDEAEQAKQDDTEQPTQHTQARKPGIDVEMAARWASALQWFQLVAPPMWLAACMASGPEASIPHAWWLGPCMLAVGLLSMRRNYHTTLRFYQHGFDSGRTDVQVSPQRTSIASDRSRWIERSIPGASPTVSAVAMQTWLSMWRAPELKLMLLAPILQPLLGLFLIRLWNRNEGDVVKTMITLALAGFGLYTSSGILGNQFGLDRGGFRTWVLSPIPRWVILHGRNLAYGLPAWLAAAILALAVGVWWGLAIDKLIFVVLVLVAYVPYYLLISDLMSILSPFGLPPGALQPKEFSWKHIAINLMLSMLHPALLCWSALPLAVEVALKPFIPEAADWPIAAVLIVPWCFVSFALYRILLPWVGRCMEALELDILKTVTAPID
jgi:hypothetical protein